MNRINANKKKLCLVIPSLQAGGMERVMAELARSFSTKEDVEVHMVLYGIKREIFYDIPSNIIVHRPSFRFNNRWRLFFTIKTILFLRKEIMNINPHSILSFGEYWNNFVLISLIGLSYQLFISDRSQPDKSLGLIHDALRKVLYPRSKGLILQTQKAKDIYVSYFKHNNIAVIGNPIKIIELKNKTVVRKNRILMVGRLINSKHQDKLIQMFAEINHKDWELVLVGYDHLKQSNLNNLRKLSLDLGVSDRVIFVGKSNNVEMYYLESSIFAFTSSSEGFPNVIGEAMSSGLPVIAFDCIAGPSEMIKDGYNGFLVPLFDFVNFQKKLSTLMNDENLRIRMGENAQLSIRRFGSQQICDSYYEFICG